MFFGARPLNKDKTEATCLSPVKNELSEGFVMFVKYLFWKNKFLTTARYIIINPFLLENYHMITELAKIYIKFIVFLYNYLQYSW